jgi:hypothetical protein
LKAHRVVAADHALLLHAQRLGERALVRYRHKGDLWQCRRLGETRIVLGQVDVADPRIGGSSLIRRSCSVPNIRSERPRASGE